MRCRFGWCWLGLIVLSAGRLAAATTAGDQQLAGAAKEIFDGDAAADPAQVETAAPDDAADQQPPIANDAPLEPTPAATNPQLARLVRSVLDEYYRRPLNTRDDSPWSVLHWSIAYGVDATVAVAAPDGRQVTAIGWLCCNYPAAGKRFINVSRGRWDLSIAPGRQGHDGQFLSMLAQSRVNRGYVLRVGDGENTVADLVQYEKQTCRAQQEHTFKLIALTHYEGTEARWDNARGEPWSVERLLRAELAAPVGRYKATCGGVHRLFALSFAAQRRQAEDLPLDGPWQAAADRAAKYQRRAFALQNSDGSFSTAWLDNAENRGDATRRLTTTGHVLEWLAASLPEDELDDPRFERAVLYAVKLLRGRSRQEWHPGALGHALHALSLYEQRTLGAKPGQRRDRLASLNAP